MKTIISDTDDIISLLAQECCDLLREKPDAVLALAGGRSVKSLYERLLGHFREGKLSFAKASVFAVGEYLDAPAEHTCRYTIWDSFLEKTDLPKTRCFFPSPASPEAYDDLIWQQGGLDLAILGIGENGQIGYNEPATPYASKTHVQTLSTGTRRQNADLFGGEELVPRTAVTMGIQTLCSANKICVLALGERKAQAVYKMLYGRNDSVIPAAFLQIPMNVRVYLDKAASSLL